MTWWPEKPFKEKVTELKKERLGSLKTYNLKSFDAISYDDLSD